MLMDVSLKYGTHRWTGFQRYLQVAWKERIKCNNYHVADLYSVATRSKPERGILFVITQSYKIVPSQIEIFK